MNIVSFNQARRDDLLEKAQAAHQKQQFREAYDFLREALRYGENAAIFNRAAGILNEMAEYESAVKVAGYALKCEPHNPQAKWEMAWAYERLWRPAEALQLLNEIPASNPLDPPGQAFSRRDDLLGMCHLKRLDLAEVQKAVFRGAHAGNLPQPIASRAGRLEHCLARFGGGVASGSDPSGRWPGMENGAAERRLGLRDWCYIMHGHRLIRTSSRTASFSLPFSPERDGPADAEPEHFVLGHPDFPDCGGILAELKQILAEEGSGYKGVYSCDANSLPVALAVSKILKLPLVDSAKLSASAPILLCLASNLGAAAARFSRHWSARHELFILAKSFERREFYDVVAPPCNRPTIQTWAEPIRSARRQIIGALGEYISLPWEAASIQARRSMNNPQEKGGNPSIAPLNGSVREPIRLENERDAVRIAERLIAAAKQFEIS